jgi:hypothetical protein
MKGQPMRRIAALILGTGVLLMLTTTTAAAAPADLQPGLLNHYGLLGTGIGAPKGLLGTGLLGENLLGGPRGGLI